MYTIKHAAALTGVAEATLRAWERRYAVVSPHRTDAGYRLYDADQVEVLRTMNDLVRRGWSPREAADRARRGAGSRTPSGDGGLGIGEREPGSETAEDRALVDAGATMDTDRLSAALDGAFAMGSFESVATTWLFPSLRALGRAWESGEISVAGEHLVSGAVLRRLAAAFDAAGRRPGAPRAVVGLPPGTRHELGLLTFATAARRAGIDIVYLGADLPEDDWARAVAEHGAHAAVIAVPCDEDVAAARAVALRLSAEHPELVVAVGGSRQDELPASCVRLGHDVAAAADRLRRLVGG